MTRPGTASTSPAVGDLDRHRDVRRLRRDGRPPPHHDALHHDPVELYRAGNEPIRAGDRSRLLPLGCRWTAGTTCCSKTSPSTAQAISRARSTCITSDAPIVTARDVTVRRLHVSGTQQAIMLWDPTLRNVTFDTVDITNALKLGIRYETIGATGIRLKNITSTGSGSGLLQLPGHGTRRRDLHQRRLPLTDRRSCPARPFGDAPGSTSRPAARALSFPQRPPQSVRRSDGPPIGRRPTALGPCAPGPVGRDLSRAGRDWPHRVDRCRRDPWRS